MDKKLLIDNKKYLSSTNAGEISGYTNDYVARLARQGKVAGKKVGGTWYVEEGSLRSFIQDNEIQKTQLHQKLSDKRVSDLKFSQRNRKTNEDFKNLKSKASLIAKTELFKKSVAFAVAITLVFGGYFVSDTDIAKAGFHKFSQAVAVSLGAISAFDPAEFSVVSIFAIKKVSEDVALNVYRGMSKTKPLAQQTSEVTYLIVSGDKDVWNILKNKLSNTAKDTFVFANNKINESVSDVKSVSTGSFETTSNIFTQYDDVQNISANIFTSITENINNSIEDAFKDEAVYVYDTTNKILCNFSLFRSCPSENLETTTMVQKVEPEELRKEVVVEQPKVPTAPRTVINQPVIERVVQTEKTLVVSGLTRSDMDLAIQQLRNKVYSDMSSLTSANETKIINNYQTIGLTNKIDKLGNVTINNSTITGTLSGLTDAHIPDGITASNYLPLAGGVMTGDLTTGSGVKLGIGTSSPTDTLSIDGAVYLSQISAPSVTTDRLYNTSGSLYWNGTALGAGGGAGGSDFWATTTNDMIVYTTDTSDVVVIGGNSTSTTGNILEVIGNSLFRGIATTTGKLSSYSYVEAPYFNATSTTATSTFSGGLDVLALNITSSTASSTFANGIDLSAGCFSINGSCVGGGGSSLWTDGGATSYLTATGDNAGIGTTTAYSKLSVWGNTTGNIFEAITSASSSALYISATGFATTTLSGLNISGSATSTSNVGYNITTGCFSINGSCVGGGGGSSLWTDNGSYLTTASGEFIDVSYFVATSTTATSTIAGGLAIETSGFVYDYSTGNVGIGTASPTTTLSVLGDVNFQSSLDSITGFQVYDADGGTPILNIDTTNERVGIGTAAPSTDLHIVGNSASTIEQMRLDNINSGADFGGVINWYGAAQNHPTGFIEVDRNGAGLDFRMKFGTTDNLTTTDALTRMIIDGNGLVGIGTTTPYSKLSIWGNTTGNIFEAITSASSSALYISATGFATTTLSGLNISGSATSTSNVGYNITTGCFSINGSCVGGGGGSSLWTDSGSYLTTAGGEFIDVSYFVATSTTATSTFAGGLAIETNGFVYDYSTNNIGIGTAAPVSDIHLLTDATTSDGLYIDASTVTTGSALEIEVDGTNMAGGFPFQITRDGSSVLSINEFGTISPGGVIVGDGGAVTLGTSNDFSFEWDTGQTNDALLFEIVVGGVNNSGNIIFVESADSATNFAHPISSNPTLYIQSSDATATSDYLKLWHDQTDANIKWGNGNLSLGNGTATTTITSTGNFGIGTSSPYRRFSVAGDTILDSTLISFASSTASILTVDYTTTATSTIVDNQIYAWTFATSTTATPIFSINTGAGDYATSSFNGGFRINSGALTYDASANKTSIERLDLGAVKFEDNAGIVSWMDMSVTSAVPVNTVESYSAQIDNTAILTIYAEADGSGGIQNTRVGVGTTTPTEQFSVSDRMYIGGTGTSTIENNLHVLGTLRATNSYVGDLIFANDFRFTEQLPISTTSMQAIYLQNQYGTTTLAIDEDGNIGVGTTSPEYKIHVIGDIAATAFVNISTADSKKNITHITDTEKGTILQKLEAVDVAQYQYKYENNDAPMRLGLIAEEAPLDVLSVSGKGVDIYKLATFTLAGVQELADKVGDLDTRLSDVEAQLASGSGGVSSGSEADYRENSASSLSAVASVINYLTSMGVSLVNGITQIASLVADSLTIGSAENPNGITLYDEVTGAPYCVKMVNGSLTPTQGECSELGETLGVEEEQSDGSTPSVEESSDTQPPIITINGNNPANINLGATYSDLGATVTDNINKNLGIRTFVDGVKVTQVALNTASSTTYTIEYSATDQAGNTATSTRTVMVGSEDEGLLSGSEADGGESLVETDTTAPLITLTGTSTVSILVGEVYTEQGATAIDDTDGDITPNITIAGDTVDTATVGIYTLTYDVSDTAGNTATRIIRTITVTEPIVVVTSTP